MEEKQNDELVPGQRVQVTGDLFAGETGIIRYSYTNIYKDPSYKAKGEERYFVLLDRDGQIIHAKGIRVTSLWLPRSSLLQLEMTSMTTVLGNKAYYPFRFHGISFEELTVLNLRHEAATKSSLAAWQIYRITIYTDATYDAPYAEEANAIFNLQTNLLGIAWRSDVTWATVKNVTEGINIWLNDHDTWEKMRHNHNERDTTSDAFEPAGVYLWQTHD